MPEGKDSWLGKDRGPYIRTSPDRTVHLADPTPEDFDDVNDLAYRLAGINRYTGGSRFSVAQHCVVASRMARKFYRREKFLPARMLIHDVDEALYGDVSSPLKALLPDYKHLEQLAQVAVEKRFDLTFIEDPLVKEVDYRMWLSERQYAPSIRQGPATSDYKGDLIPFPLEAHAIVDNFHEWDAERAENQWLLEFRLLFPWLDEN